MDESRKDGAPTDRALAGAARAEFESAQVLPAGAPSSPPSMERAGDTIGGYVLVEPLGEGGMGVVWSALQESPIRRRVALKVIRFGLESAEVMARFREEQRALALMKHPHIAAVLDGGVTERGRPYFVMEHVEGTELMDYCASRKLDLEQRLALFIQIASAIEHAHQKGVIHRDIKPSNVLVTEVDGLAYPKVIDFGIAKTVSHDQAALTQWTEHRQLIGTLAYMSPEQAGIVDQDVDTRADVYSLGSMLYELLTGARPFESEERSPSGLEQSLRALREIDPERPSSRLAKNSPGREHGALKGDLDWVVLRALEKDRERRYPSSAALAADVERFLKSEVVEARPPSRGYRAKKFVQRHRGGVVAAALLGVAVVAGVAGTGYGLVRSLEANESLREETQRAERELARATASRRLLSEMLTSVAPRLARGKDTTLLTGILDATSERLNAGEIADPAVAADLEEDLGRSYLALGRFTEALVHLSRWGDAAAALFGKESPAALRAKSLQATALRSMERVDEGEVLVRATLKAQEESRGPLHPETLRTRAELGMLLFRAGRLDEAELTLKQVVDAERDVLEGPERARSQALISLATLHHLGRFDVETAKPLFLEALELTETHLGEDDPLTLRTLEHLGQIESILGDMDAALARGEVVVERIRRVFGPEHRETLGARGNHALTLFRAERYEQSGAIFEQLLEDQRRVLPKDDPDTLWTEMQVALHEATAGRFDEAAERLQRLIAVKDSLGVPPVEETINLGLVLRDMSDVRGAIELFERFSPVIESLVGPEHEITQMVTDRLAAWRDAEATQATD